MLIVYANPTYKIAFNNICDDATMHDTLFKYTLFKSLGQ